MIWGGTPGVNIIVAAAAALAHSAVDVIDAPAIGPTTLPEWQAERAEINRRLADIKDNFDQLARFIEYVGTAHKQRRLGDNHPPEPIESLPLDMGVVFRATKAANTLQLELASGNPSLKIIRSSCGVLNLAAARVAAFLRWLTEKGDIFFDEFSKSAGKTAGKPCLQF